MAQTNRTWFRRAFNLKKSILPQISLRLFVVTLFFILITFLNGRFFNFNIPVLSALVPNVILGLLLVFRTNTAYERFWEGRRLWGDINNNVRNIILEINTINISFEKKKELSKYLINFVILTKDKFRDDVQTDMLIEEQKSKVHPNLWELNQLNLQLDELTDQKVMSEEVFIAINSHINNIINAVGGCERIIATPIPLGYSIHIKQLILMYCLTLPFQFVGEVGWLTPILCFFIAFALMGIEQIGLEIENPFGKDNYDIDLDKICENIKRNVEDLLI
ncbi:MAG: bestrophin family protein [Patescibacteria group bacterium]